MRTSVMPDMLEVQGEVIKLKVANPAMARPDHPTRGKVTRFTRKSRRRMLELTARLAETEKPPVFLTLTYRSNMTDPKRGKQHLRAFLERVKRRYPRASGIWRMEFQERGAVHFHFIFFNVPFWPAQNIRQIWGEIIGEYNPRIHIELCKGRRKLGYYLSKYIAKVSDLDSIFIKEPYLHAGRHWGIMLRKQLPWARRHKFVIHSQKAFWDIRRAIDRYYPQRNMSFPCGCMLFTSTPEDWLRYIFVLGVGEIAPVGL